jgi:hypothetical protein
MIDFLFFPKKYDFKKIIIIHHHHHYNNHKYIIDNLIILINWFYLLKVIFKIN